MSDFKHEIPLHHHKTLGYRLLEILPGALSWSILLAPLILALVSTYVASVFIIIYMVAWSVKAFVMIFRVMQGYNKVELYSSMDWADYLEELDNITDPDTLKTLRQRTNTRFDAQHKDLAERMTNFDKLVLPKDVLHAVVLPVYNESYDIVKLSIEALANSDYDVKSKVWLYIAYEERGGEQVKKDMTKLAREYKSHFAKLELSEHPDGIEDEVKGKGGNIYMAGKQLMSDIEKAKIDPDTVVVTTIDADNRVHRRYLSALTYFFATTEHKAKMSYQPVPLYTNNIWDVPAPVRVSATGNSFYQVIQSTRPYLLRNFSAHAQSLSGLIATDLWSVRTVVEDGHQYWRSFLAFKGDYDVMPIFVPVYQDAVLADGFLATMKAQFVQRRRWAYGCSDIPYLIWQWWHHRKDMPFFRTWSRIIRIIEAHISLATASLVLAFGGWGPWIVERLSGGDSSVALLLPEYTQLLRNLALIGIPVSIYLGFKILPPRPERYLKRRTAWMVLQWAWLPIAALLFGTIAALNAQTRLLLGKYLDVFDVTQKIKK